MKIELSHQQRQMLTRLGAGDVTLTATDEGTFRGTLLVERESAEGFVAIATDGRVLDAAAFVGAEDERRAGPLTVDNRRMMAFVDGSDLGVSRMEFRLLWALAADPDRVYDKTALLRDVWGYEALGQTRTVDAHACRLRKKLAFHGLGDWIVAVRGVGYRLKP